MGIPTKGKEQHMKRRTFLKAAGIGGAAAALASPAIAQSSPTINWRLQSSYPKSLETLFGACTFFSEAVSEMTDGKFKIQIFAAGEIVPALQVADAVGNSTVEMGQTGSYFYIGKDMGFAFGTAIPWGMNSRQQSAWMYRAGGLEIMNEMYAKYGILRIARRQHRHPDGRLVPQGDQVGRRPQRPQDAHRRPRRQRDAEARRGAAATRRRRYLSGAGERRDRRRRIRRPL